MAETLARNYNLSDLTAGPLFHDDEKYTIAITIGKLERGSRRQRREKEESEATVKLARVFHRGEYMCLSKVGSRWV